MSTSTTTITSLGVTTGAKEQRVKVTKPAPVPASKPAPGRVVGTASSSTATQMAMRTVDGGTKSLDHQVKLSYTATSSAFHKAGFDKNGIRLTGAAHGAALDHVEKIINYNTVAAKFNAIHDVSNAAEARRVWLMEKAAKAAVKKVVQ